MDELGKVTMEIFSKLEQKWLYQYEGKKTRILSIDGGCTTGIVCGASLIHLEDQICSKTGDPNGRITDFFDIIAGTGIGAIFTAMLVANGSDGRPLFTAKDAVKFVTENQSKLFKAKNNGVFTRKMRFSGKSMDKVLKEAFTREDGRVLTLKDTCKPILVPCFDLKSSAPFVFSRADATESINFDFELWKVCHATSANPSMLKPFPLSSVDGKTSCLAVDGGVVMNNPAAAAVTHVLHNKRDFPSVTSVDDLLVLSLGNGPLSSPSKLKLRNDGYCSSSSVVGIVVDGLSETVDQILGNAFCWNPNDYVRIQANGYTCGGVGPSEEEVLEERGVESLPFGGKRLLTETNGQRIGSFVQRLVNSSLPPSPCKETAVNPLTNGR
ncbi:probable inactive patatin-like protein 9 [Lycium barbarum]|uniref:probable inactive patatin-like protein 9 n=1 Tax=Lycium barbarum TaxID=112863 RepID=UPI00293ED0D1|nr:probable inactive patatin-like protein 9 [Lycium barbarum]XP_060178175.1 probable inactive patatin-like protein 9 [Lycium barbarum]XP_060178179.1 probable inactive patatin-like protein 9 [Lycium barbarum]XP_060178180.1 probable inactive patatin-like protein 9 [Lycium barbarum]XP_060178185.1 probable inactive patatin-like protein 9 [Lycium barbarum]XP_060178189.1 probable inactive patatin-like protein 9 [Lycium barbarum]XP_060178193.1 probable inactive patatin-like protein 9 [Lycium barbaru